MIEHKTAAQLGAMTDEELVDELVNTVMNGGPDDLVHIGNVRERILDRMDRMRHYRKAAEDERSPNT